MRILPPALLLLAVVASAVAQTPVPIPPPDREIPLYAGTAPGSETWDWKERTVTINGLDFTQNVVRPVLQYYAADPAKACGTAVIIAPGGGSVNLTIRYEGTDVAHRLNAMGVAAFILKYRVVRHDPVTSRPDPRAENGVVLSGPQKGQNIYYLEGDDGRQAMRWLRLHASEFGCSPHRIVFVGFSAGGGVALAMLAGPKDSRPDFVALIYGSGDGKLKPPADAPPLFLAAAADDDHASDGSLQLFASWRAAKRPAEIHIFQMGGHGFLKKGGGGDHVIDRLGEWLQCNGLLTRPPS